MLNLPHKSDLSWPVSLFVCKLFMNVIIYLLTASRPVFSRCGWRPIGRHCQRSNTFSSRRQRLTLIWGQFFSRRFHLSATLSISCSRSFMPRILLVSNSTGCPRKVSCYWCRSRSYHNVPVKIVLVRFDYHTSRHYCKLLLNILLIKYSIYDVVLDVNWDEVK